MSHAVEGSNRSGVAVETMRISISPGSTPALAMAFRAASAPMNAAAIVPAGQSAAPGYRSSPGSTHRRCPSSSVRSSFVTPLGQEPASRCDLDQRSGASSWLLLPPVPGSGDRRPAPWPHASRFAIPRPGPPTPDRCQMAFGGRGRRADDGHPVDSRGGAPRHTPGSPAPGRPRPGPAPSAWCAFISLFRSPDDEGRHRLVELEEHVPHEAVADQDVAPTPDDVPPSMFPMKFRSLAARSLWDSTVSSFPFSGSSPMLRSPMRGSATPMRS
jgi:hypothetical protein